MALTETEFGKFHYFSPDIIGQTIANGQFWEAHLRKYMDDLNEGDVFVDVGANIGFFSLYCAMRRKAIVYAFEPCPEVFGLLLENISINNAKKVMAYKVALYDKKIELALSPKWNDWPKLPDGRVDYSQYPNSGGLSLVPGHEGVYRFLSQTIDGQHFQKLNLLKVDTQGADLRILVGGVETIKRLKPVILFEYEDCGRGRNASGDSFQDFVDFLHQLGYKIEHCGGEDFVAIFGGLNGN